MYLLFSYCITIIIRAIIIINTTNIVLTFRLDMLLLLFMLLFGRLFELPKSCGKTCKKCNLSFYNYVQYRAQRSFSEHNRHCNNYIALSSRERPSCFFINKEAADALIKDPSKNKIDLLDPFALPIPLTSIAKSVLKVIPFF